jgi:hypothetical protein
MPTSKEHPECSAGDDVAYGTTFLMVNGDKSLGFTLSDCFMNSL